MIKYSAVILAGGKSSRMGRKKATLTLGEESFMDILIRKLNEAGIEDIIISGYDADGRYPCVRDIYPDKGPLAGVHAGLLAAANESALVLTEDAPLIPADYIRKLLKVHEDIKMSGMEDCDLKARHMSITLSCCNGRLQQFPGVYDKSLVPVCEELLQGERARVMALIDRVGCNTVAFSGDELLLKGCNTPEEYERVKEMIKNQ